MAINFFTPQKLLNQLQGDHRSHLRSLGAVLARSVVADLNNRTGRLDARNAAKAIVGVIKARSLPNGSIGYSITITQNIMPDLSEDKRKKIRAQQANVRAKLATKHGVTSYLAAGGVH